jgi:predicted TIM-barrel fold metal-dependent hydrolase
MIPVHDLDLAIAEVERIARLGLPGAMLPLTPPEGRPYHLPEYEPLWDALDSQQLPVSAHIVTGTPAHVLAGGFVNREAAPPISLFGEMRAAASAQLMLHDLVVGGVLERHPTLHFVMVEAGSAWLAWLMESMDAVYDRPPMRRARRAAALSLRPSEYLRRQCHATFMSDRIGVANRDVTGVEALLWANDYPHPEGTYPNSLAKLDQLFAGVPTDERRAMTGGTAARIWGFEPASA